MLVGLWLAIALGAATMTGGPSLELSVERAPLDMPYGDTRAFDGPAETAAAEDPAVTPDWKADREEDIAAAEAAAVEKAKADTAAAETMQAEAAAAETAKAEAAGREPRSERGAMVLSDADVERYRKIFGAQQRARWKTANTLIAELEDKTLLGHVLAQRYLHPSYRSRYRQLRLWRA